MKLKLLPTQPDILGTFELSAFRDVSRRSLAAKAQGLTVFGFSSREAKGLLAPWNGGPFRGTPLGCLSREHSERVVNIYSNMGECRGQVS